MIRLLSRVNAHVALQRLKVAEVSPADLAGVRLLSCVDQHMGAKVGHLGDKHTHIKQNSHWEDRRFDISSKSYFLSHLNKSGAACLTLVWLLSRVDAGVGLEVGWPVELGAADVAVVGL